MTDDVRTVAVVGAGSMGHGIAQLAAMAGYEVTLNDVDEDRLDAGYDDIEWSLGKLDESGRLDEDPDAVLDRIEAELDLEAAVADADLVVEAAPEKLDLKRDLFADLDRAAPDGAILATNTSSLSITDIGAATDRPGQVVGLHFFNPPVKMDLVEVIYGEETADETAEAAHGFAESLGKTPIYVRKDVRGFVVNSVLLPTLVEAAWMVSDDEATVREVDAAMVHRRGLPMGPFELADMTGIDVNYHVLTEADVPVPPAIAERYEAGDYGRKTGTGFYDYEDGDGVTYEPGDGVEVDALRIEARAVNAAAELVGDDVATPEAVDTGLRLGAGYPAGPCRRGDEIGLDHVYVTLRRLRDGTGADRHEPADYLRELVESGRTGVTVGEGFYDHDDGEEYAAIRYDLDDRGLLSITLDRPERLNALSDRLLGELSDLLDAVDTDEVRCVTIEGAGEKAFSAGADVGDISATPPHERIDVTEGIEAVAEFPRPVIAKVNGYCLGGGHELALACDLRIATTDSQFGFPEINLGLLPGGGGTQRTLDLVSQAQAKELVLRGHRIDAERAEEWGLINRAVEPEAFEATVEEFVEDLVTGPPVALKVAKRLLDRGVDADLATGLTMASQGIGVLLSTDDAAEGAAAFEQRRDPEFEGH